MIISIGTEKASDKIQHPLMIKILNELYTEEIHANTMKTMYEKPTANTIFNGVRLKAFP